MQIDQHHLIQGVTFNPSPHCDLRPVDSDISLLVIHNISLPPGEFGSGDIDALFMGRLDCDRHSFYQQLRGLRVSAHAVIDRQGEVIQYVPFNQRAWHAGLSSYDGRSRCNDFSIGIELEGTDTLPYTEQQYVKLIALTRALLQRYPAMDATRIVGHCDIAPERKSDPGEAFDWHRYRQDI